MGTAIDVVLAKPDPTREDLMSMAAEMVQAVDHSERLIEVLLILARNDQARALTDPLDLAAVAEDALERRAAGGVTTTATLGEAPVTGDGVLLERPFLPFTRLDDRTRQAGRAPVATSPRQSGRLG